MDKVYDFLIDIANNNNKVWFDANKDRYKEVQQIVNKFADELIGEIAKWDKDINPDKLTYKDCTYRIYRDVRFRKDKTPYKTHIGVYICRGGKKSPYSGYYFHIEPKVDGVEGFWSGIKLYTGVYVAEGKILHSLRDEIYVNGGSVLSEMTKLESDGFESVNLNKLKKLPKGFEDVNPEWAELIKQKDFAVGKGFGRDILSREGLAEFVSAEFEKTYKFSQILNMAVEYALDEM